MEEEYADKVKSINAQLASDIQAENDKYENALKSREDSLYKSYGLFDAVKERDEVSGDTLMKNLEGQVKEFGEWQDILESLAGRGLDSDLIEELQDMGPDAIAQIKALNDMSDSELEKYAGLWKVKHAMARGGRRIRGAARRDPAEYCKTPRGGRSGAYRVSCSLAGEDESGHGRRQRSVGTAPQKL